MRSRPSHIPVVVLVLSDLERHGFKIEPIALNPVLMRRPDGFATAISFGHRIEGLDAASVAELEIKVDLRGDIDTGELRRWQIARTYAVKAPNLSAVCLNTVLTMDGDISASFVRRDGKASLAMATALIKDVNAELARVPRARHSHSREEPVVHLAVKVAGEIAMGRGGLVRTHSRIQATPEACLVRRMICECLVSSIIPELGAIAGNVAAKGRDAIARIPMAAGIHAEEGAAL